MPILTLTTDWGVCDPYVACFKGSLMMRNSSLQVIDISHEITHFDILTAAYIIKTTYDKFPKGSIHYIGLTGPENHDIEYPFLIVESDGYYFLGFDSGIFSLVLDEKPKNVFYLDARQHEDRKKVEELVLDTLVSLGKGINPSKLGTEQQGVLTSYFAVPTTDANTIRGSIIYVDSFGNAIMNVTKDFFEKEHKNRPFSIYMRKSNYTISKISKSYEDTENGEIVAFFNTNGYLEIALNRGNASGLLGLKVMDAIRIEFQ
ncbi:MAG TPA: SAM-dependent chlorinase/fluorinase [Bacteroidia bacterium]|nr:SAM-dependent chlorinase/fluorinase [Bacteroidota bacterium]HQV99441.1 SAM-dependent chlorinase/fluorinase [Bacteroidia bacterium]